MNFTNLAHVLVTFNPGIKINKCKIVLCIKIIKPAFRIIRILLHFVIFVTMKHFLSKMHLQAFTHNSILLYFLTFVSTIVKKKREREREKSSEN